MHSFQIRREGKRLRAHGSSRNPRRRSHPAFHHTSHADTMADSDSSSPEHFRGRPQYGRHHRPSFTGLPPPDFLRRSSQHALEAEDRNPELASHRRGHIDHSPSLTPRAPHSPYSERDLFSGILQPRERRTSFAASSFTDDQVSRRIREPSEQELQRFRENYQVGRQTILSEVVEAFWRLFPTSRRTRVRAHSSRSKPKFLTV